MRYACPSCGRWVRPFVEVIAVSCTRCGAYARREEEDQDPLFARGEAPGEEAAEEEG
ncbi:flagellar M-ring protein FliF [Oceanithermus profundus DSM 14977]|uniref:Flagellar M-ring protein FliF n=1 Tax=Oceanithermus profundus (strain DSM 14977 / NBRC 100410 / VKM B-2274 / 506) TaxID=670487 RepID=E4U5J2_OCEP5|nr:hypothetical protein [Oceanithermus profundus]ADR35495.1 flagellar M-ring protein FliF [Oceanithermus profundus DSM 14977]